MYLNESPEHRAYRATVRSWFEQNKPGALETLEERRTWHRKLYDAGFVGMGWPKKYGGQEASPIEQAIVGEEMARSGAPGTINGLGIDFIGPTLIAHGTDAQKERYVKKILTAEELWCQIERRTGHGPPRRRLVPLEVVAGAEIHQHRAPALGADAYQLADAIAIDRHKRVSFEDCPLGVVGQNRPGVVA